MKKCGKCKELKSKDNFAKRVRAKDGLQSRCKDCVSSHDTHRYHQGKSEWIAGTKKRKDELSQWFIFVKCGQICQHCNKPYHHSALDFHHVDDSKEANISDMVRNGCGKDRILAEMAKCIVLCSNCHRIHHWEEREKAA